MISSTRTDAKKKKISGRADYTIKIILGSAASHGKRMFQNQVSWKSISWARMTANHTNTHLCAMCILQMHPSVKSPPTVWQCDLMWSPHIKFYIQDWLGKEATVNTSAGNITPVRFNHTKGLTEIPGLGAAAKSALKALPEGQIHPHGWASHPRSDFPVNRGENTKDWLSTWCLETHFYQHEPMLWKHCESYTRNG